MFAILVYLKKCLPIIRIRISFQSGQYSINYTIPNELESISDNISQLVNSKNGISWLHFLSWSV